MSFLFWAEARAGVASEPLARILPAARHIDKRSCTAPQSDLQAVGFEDAHYSRRLRVCLLPTALICAIFLVVMFLSVAAVTQTPKERRGDGAAELLRDVLDTIRRSSRRRK